ncbi:fimbrial protein [Candidatus Pantoea multigeneris]|uniref:Fimbrial protein n=1 Tax=Candidatus Pantoea multigeneris TaxID=2608357 RepID=A0ABX0RN03_9GAMM|nr:fimbrial protein [Pantoea multigeneris]NIF24730.1 fimbrial protein [Pantoea multigeneris]
MKNHFSVFAVILFCYALEGTASTASTPMKLKGRILDTPPCTINNEKDISVNFGNKIVSGKINGENYLQNITYLIDCRPAPAPFVLYLNIKGTPEPYDASAIKSSKKNLGIRILIDGKPWALNTPLAIHTKRPLLQAVPVKPQGTVVNPGNFQAVATLEAFYL